MWIPKPASEVAAEIRIRRQRYISLAVVAAACVGGGAAIFSIWLALPAGGAVLLAGLWRCRSTVPGHPTMICQQCNKVKIADAQTGCACGGRFYHLHEMKWADVPPKPGDLSSNSLEISPHVAAANQAAKLRQFESQQGKILVTTVRKVSTVSLEGTLDTPQLS